MRYFIVCLLFSLGLAATFDTYSGRVALSPNVFVSTKVVGSKVKFLIEKNAAGHVAFGIGASMADSDIVVIERTTSVVTLRDCKLTGQTAPTCSEITEDWKFADETTTTNSYELTASTMKVEFTRNLAASGNDADKEIVNGANTFIWSYNTQNTLSKHDMTGGRGTTAIDITISAAPGSGSGSGSGNTTPSFDTYTIKMALGSKMSVSSKVVADKVKFLVEKTDAGHVAFGIGTSMNDGDIVAIERSSNGEVILKDCKLIGKQMPSCTTTSNNWMFVDSANPKRSYELTSTTMKVEITRALAASTASGSKAIINGENTFIFSYSSNDSLSYHDSTGDRGVSKIDLGSNLGSNGGSTKMNNARMIVNWLAIIAFVSFFAY